MEKMKTFRIALSVITNVVWLFAGLSIMIHIYHNTGRANALQREKEKHLCNISIRTFEYETLKQLYASKKECFTKRDVGIMLKEQANAAEKGMLKYTDK